MIVALPATIASPMRPWRSSRREPIRKAETMPPA
jgi:hypothetical protein